PRAVRAHSAAFDTHSAVTIGETITNSQAVKKTEDDQFSERSHPSDLARKASYQVFWPTATAGLYSRKPAVTNLHPYTS
ncbi:hypothetical protein OFB79_24780, partial [Escherichia coli]|nr:hypothetical protein [Escherichia coli]